MLCRAVLFVCVVLLRGLLFSDCFLQFAWMLNVCCVVLCFVLLLFCGGLLLSGCCVL